MGKGRLILVVALAAVFVLALAAPALATTHGNYSTTTDACAGCHVAHAAQAPKLLKMGPTQTQFCYMCHGQGGPGAPYDIEYGKTVGTQTYESTAGGFVKITEDGTTAQDVTSRHTVWGYVYDANGQAGVWGGESYTTTVVPGGTQNLTGNGLVCGSCHNPHAGGSNPPNPRLLRTSILDSTNLTVTFTLTDAGNGAYRVTAYNSGSTAWCGACHNKFKTTQGSGHTKDSYNMYRHAMDVTATLPSGSDGTIDDGTPLETGKVACLTCHRAHGTAATVTGYALSWPRSEGGTGTTSALLRMQNRGVCYNCHGAAQYNTPTTP